MQMRSYVERAGASGRFAAIAAALVVELDLLANRLAAAIANPPTADPLEEQLRRAERPKDLAALVDAYDEVACKGRAIAANYALLGPRSVAERFGVPDAVEATDGKSWWYWRIDADRSLGIAFAPRRSPLAHPPPAPSTIPPSHIGRGSSSFSSSARESLVSSSATSISRRPSAYDRLAIFAARS